MKPVIIIVPSDSASKYLKSVTVSRTRVLHTLFAPDGEACRGDVNTEGGFRRQCSLCLSESALVPRRLSSFATGS